MLMSDNIKMYIIGDTAMANIPDWAWKLLTSLIVPIALWAIATHVSIKNHDLRLTQLEQKVVNNDKQLQMQRESLGQTKQDIEIMKVRVEYISNGIDEIKTILQKNEK